MVDAKKIKIISFLFVIFQMILIAKAEEPILVFEQSPIELTMIPKSSTNFEIYINAFSGNESTSFTVFSAGELEHWINFFDTYFLISSQESQKVSFKINIPEETSEGVYNGSIRLTSFKGQFLVLNISVTVRTELGRLVVESLFSEEVPHTFNISLLNSEGEIVDFGVVNKGYWFSNFLPLGVYTLITDSNVYENKEISFNLFNSEKSILLKLDERKGPFLLVEPQHSYIETCPDKKDFSTIRLKNGGFEELNISVFPSNSIISIISNKIVLESEEYKDIRFEIQELSPGSYESELLISHLGFEDIVKVFVEVYPRSSCETTFTGLTVQYSNFSRIPIGLDHFFVISVSDEFPSTILKLEQTSTDFSTSFFPKYYSNLDSGITVPFLVKLFSDNSSEGFIILKVRNTRGEESLVINVKSSELNAEILIQEISDLSIMLSIFENNILSNSESDEDVFKISELKILLDEASNHVNSDLYLAKEKVDIVLNESLLLFDAYFSEKNSDNSFIFLIMLFIVFLFAGLFFLRKKTLFNKYLNNLRKEGPGVI
ncbi:MAG: hypothetical protein GON13_03825 [Nanoarchaeota archaeon]|nr:hypothetical protein [Nanoarchaeota archaeon]